jgi:hypothetical protein
VLQAQDVPQDNAQAEADLYQGDHAILHDFCMQIPYSIIIMGAGMFVLIRKPIAAGVLMLLAGWLVLQCAQSSLRQWKVGLRSTGSTWCCAIISSYLTWVWGARSLPLACGLHTTAGAGGVTNIALGSLACSYTSK